MADCISRNLRSRTRMVEEREKQKKLVAAEYTFWTALGDNLNSLMFELVMMCILLIAALFMAFMLTIDLVGFPARVLLKLKPPFSKYRQLTLNTRTTSHLK